MQRHRQVVKIVVEEIFSTNGHILFCKVSEIKISVGTFTMWQYIGHCKQLLVIQNTKRKMSKVLTGQGGTSTATACCKFFMDFYDVLASANIPL